jgi:hypothetical protein
MHYDLKMTKFSCMYPGYDVFLYYESHFGSEFCQYVSANILRNKVLWVGVGVGMGAAVRRPMERTTAIRTATRTVQLQTMSPPNMGQVLAVLRIWISLI